MRNFRITRNASIWVLSSAIVPVFVGCITSPVWKYGDTKIAKETEMSSCLNGLLDDAEDGNTQVAIADGRDGYWFAFVDTWGSVMEPKNKFVMAKGGFPEGKSQFAANVKGKLAEAGDSVYAGFGFAFTNPKTPFDISKAKGIRFWAKGPGKIRFKIPDRNTDPVGDRCTDCYNDFGVDIYLQDTWMRYTVPFDAMTQHPGWGDRAPSVDADGAFAVQWQYDTPGGAYDIWVDQIELVGCSPQEAR
jgi:endoglucanase